jgi:beta-lactamase regulating signal transducer with metallopeptidase domain
LIQLALDTFVKSAIILLAAGLLAALLRRASAASRHLVWSVAIVSLLALLLFSFALPSWRMPMLPSLATAAVIDEGVRESVDLGGGAVAAEFEHQREARIPVVRRRQTFDIGSELPASSSVAPQPVVQSKNSFDWKAILSLVWLAGALVVMARLAVGVARVWLLTRRAQPVGETWAPHARMLATQLRLRSHVEIFKTDQVSLPMTWGLLRSVVLLPKDAEQWPVECRRIVLLHELTHVKRRDCLMQALAQLACALYWFNPLVWIAAWRLRVEREVACDDHVLEAGTKASDYASHLVEIASFFKVSNCGSPVAVGMACSHLESRVRSILDPNARRRGASGLKVALAAVLAALLTASLAMLHPWREAEAKDLSTFNLISSPTLPFPANLLIQSFKNQDQAGESRESEERQKQSGEGVGDGQGTGQGAGQGAGQGQGKSGELTVEQLIEMKAVGVTPEYIESIRKLGYSDLTVKQAVELRAVGVDEEFVKQARGWTNGNPTIEELVELKAIGMSSEFINGMKQAGYGALTVEKLVEMKAVGVNENFIKEMREMGFDKLTINQLIEMKAVGVTPDYIKKMRAIGLKNVSINELIELKATGVDKILTREKR